MEVNGQGEQISRARRTKARKPEKNSKRNPDCFGKKNRKDGLLSCKPENNFRKRTSYETQGSYKQNRKTFYFCGYGRRIGDLV